MRLTLTVPWAQKASDIDLQLGTAHDTESVVLRVLPSEGNTLELPVRLIAGVGEFELEVKETGLQVHTTCRAASGDGWAKPRFHRRRGALDVAVQVEEGAAPSKLCDVILPLAAPEGHLQLQALPFGLPGAVGSHLWPSALLLFAQLRRRYAAATPPRGRTERALELGSGCGAGGLVAAAHGAQVTCSDCDPRVLPLLRANCADFARRQGACAGHGPKVIKLDFASEEDCRELASQGPFDLLLASDVLYEHQLVPKFFRCARALVAPGGEVLLAVELRPCGVDLSEAIVAEAKKIGFEAQDVTKKLKIWVTPVPSELKIPPLEERHRIFVATESTQTQQTQQTEEGQTAVRVKSHQPWKDAEKEWYQRSLQFWSKQDATDSGVLDGHVETSHLDLQESNAFLKAVLHPEGLCRTALDCGAGVGRITEGLLLDQVTDAVDLLEPCAHLLQEARKRLAEQPKARHFLELSLQNLEALPDQYDLIWVQWVLLYLTDADLRATLKRLQEALRPNGLLIIKENCLLNTSAGWVDHRDSSLCRSDAALQQIFAEVGLRLRSKELQREWPDTMLPVMMYALQ